MDTTAFIERYRESDINDIAFKVRQFPAVDAAFALQQIEGWQRCRHKLPTIAANAAWHYPKRISLEQCSSEATCRYKQTIVSRLLSTVSGQRSASCGADLTGGLGADSFFLAPMLSRWDYVERDAELCQLAQHNFAGTNISVHNESAEEFIAQHNNEHFSLIYIDPARRDSQGRKVVLLADCQPDITSLYPTLARMCDLLIVKLSPMHDLHEALRAMPQATEAHVVAVDGEVKELVICSQRSANSGQQVSKGQIYAVNITEEEQRLVFDYDEERQTHCELATGITEGDYIYEPNAAILKAGAFRTIATRFGLQKADHNTHLYVRTKERSTMYEGNEANATYEGVFPGRVMRVEKVLDKRERQQLTGTTANVICRNYPLRADELKKKLKIKDGGDTYIVGLRLQGKPMLLQCRRCDAPLIIQNDQH